MTKMNRRTLLKYAGTGMVAGVLSNSIGKVIAATMPDSGDAPTGI